MFPDTMNFTDPAYSTGDPTADPLAGTNNTDLFYSNIFNNAPASGDSPALGMGSTPPVDAFYSNLFATPPSTGGAASNTPAQGSTSGAGLLGWLGLGTKIAQTATSAAKTGATTRPGVASKPTSTLGSFGSVTTTTLFVIVAIFVGVVFLLRK